MSEKRLVIVEGVRTPFSRMGTDLSDLDADGLGRAAVASLLARTGIDPDLISEVIFGCVGQPVDAANVSRIIALRAGIPENIPAITVNRNCASGCESLTQAYEKMVAGRGDIYIVGGAESMSRYPFVFNYNAVKKFAALGRAKKPLQKLAAALAFRPSDFAPRIGLKLGLSDPFSGLNMGETAELIGRENGITRMQADAFAAESHRRALDARERLAEEIAPVYVEPKFKKVVTEDNGPRTDSTEEKLARLRPVFERGSGNVTAGNASQITDGAAAMLVMSEEKAEELGYEPLGRLLAYTYAACDPARMGLGPVYAIHKAEQQSGLKLEDADLVEINEAFAAQVLACLALMKSESFAKEQLGRDRIVGELPHEKLNVNGGSIALGHPVGATGARLVITALKELKRRNGNKALISACVGGGQGVACWVERI